MRARPTTRSRASCGEEQSAAPVSCIASAAAAALAEAALELGFYISISGIVTFRKAEELRAIVRDVPLDRLLVETDAPYLAPVPYRGKRNEPAYCRRHRGGRGRAERALRPSELAATTTENFFRLFQKARRPWQLDLA